MKTTLPFLCLLLPNALCAQADVDAFGERIAAAATHRAAWPFDRVLYDTGIDGRLWAAGATWKASFGADGFTYLPRFGASAPSSPLHFRVAAVRVGGRDLALPPADAAARSGDVVSFARGALRESYQLALEQVEQTFTIDAGPGDVEVELTLTTDLVERAGQPGLQFASEHGEVGYSDAFLVTGTTKTPIATTWDGHTLRLRVAAAQRGDGPVVIDPILNTRSASTTAVVPSIDVAYDATLQRYLLVWEVTTSLTDHDVVSEQFDANGDPVPGSAAPVEISGLFADHPCVANLDVADAFLVAFSLADPNFGNRRMVFSRTFDSATSVVGAYERLSNPFWPGDNITPDVGGDPGSDPSSPHDWLVVWSNATSPIDANVHGRAVLANGTPKHSWVLVIEDQLDRLNTVPRVSPSNGNGRVPHPQWLVAYSRPVSQVTTEIHARSLDLGFVLGNEISFNGSSLQNLNPQVCSPIRFGSNTAFLVAWERATASSCQASLLFFAPSYAFGIEFNLTASFGLDGQGLRAESDGVRFVIASHGPGQDERVVSTLALTASGGLLLQDGPISLGTSTRPPEIVACRSSGGPAGQYGIAWTEFAGVSLPKLTRYGGHEAGTLVTVQSTACHGLGIQTAGSPVLGDAMQFALSNSTGDIPGFAFGFPVLAPTPICSSCAVGLRLDLPIVVDLGSTSFTVPIPPVATLVGSSFAVQGLGLGTWPCFGLRFSDTVMFTVR